AFAGRRRAGGRCRGGGEEEGSGSPDNPLDEASAHSAWMKRGPADGWGPDNPVINARFDLLRGAAGMKVAAILGPGQGGLVERPDPAPGGEFALVRVRVTPMCTE